MDNETTLPQDQELDTTPTEIVKLEEELSNLQDKLMRTLAESDNARKRLEKAAQDAADYSITKFAKELITVMDNLSRALSYAPETNDEQMQNFIDGINMTQSELKSVFNKNGIESVAPQAGDKFDYNFHHAIQQIPHEEYEPNTILETMQPGYKIKDRLLRPASVVVTSKKS